MHMFGTRQGIEACHESLEGENPGEVKQSVRNVIFGIALQNLFQLTIFSSTDVPASNDLLTMDALRRSTFVVLPCGRSISLPGTAF
jgi:hypothetical protein